MCLCVRRSLCEKRVEVDGFGSNRRVEIAASDQTAIIVEIAGRTPGGGTRIRLCVCV